MRNHKLLLYSALLIVVTILALIFYALFKPSEVILNILLSYVLSIKPLLIEHNNFIIDTFIQTFGDFLSVFMVFMILAIIIHIIQFPFSESKVLFQWIIVPFIVFEFMQIIGPGNFLIRDLIAYAIGYQLGFYVINTVEKTSFDSLFTRCFKWCIYKRKDIDNG